MRVAAEPLSDVFRRKREGVEPSWDRLAAPSEPEVRTPHRERFSSSRNATLTWSAFPGMRRPAQFARSLCVISERRWAPISRHCSSVSPNEALNPSGVSKVRMRVSKSPANST